MKKIILSVSIIGVVAAIAFGITTAFFSDTETSTGNTFTAGSLDLKIGSDCHYNDMICTSGFWTGSGTDYPIGLPCTCAWGVDNFTGQAFFNFTDIKPGDTGESTLHFKLDDNPAWACMFINNIVDSDYTCTEPEMAAETALSISGGCTNESDGELDENLKLTIWIDDGVGAATECDNIWQDGEQKLLDNQPLSLFLHRNETTAIMPIAAPASSGGWRTTPIPAGEHCIGIKWSVDGTTGNEVQSDKLGADLKFYVEQSRNNAEFTCAGKLQ